MNPSPPICMSRSSTHWPNCDSVCPGSITDSPVTHTADVAVNSASAKPMLRPLRADTGSASTAAPASISAANPRASTRTGFRCRRARRRARGFITLPSI